MSINNEKGFTLLEMLAAIVVVTFVMTSGYKIITMFAMETKQEMEETSDVLQIDGYNRLFLDDLRHAENIQVNDTEGIIQVTYRIKGKDKEIVFKPNGENEYEVDYKDSDVKKENWLRVETPTGGQPLEYDHEEGNITLHHVLGDILYDYSIRIRRGVG